VSASPVRLVGCLLLAFVLTASLVACRGDATQRRSIDEAEYLRFRAHFRETLLANDKASQRGSLLPPQQANRELLRLARADDALAAEAEAKKCFGLGGGGEFDEGRQPRRPASPAALPLSSASRPSSTDSLGVGGEAAAAKRKQKHQQRETKKKDPAVEQYLDELSRLRAEAEKAFSGTGGERAAVA
jgi:hypothetical protein